MTLPVTNTAVHEAAGTNPEGEQGQYLTFALRGEMFAIGILHIKEILEYGQLTTVPMMPDFIRGVINLRGAVVPVSIYGFVTYIKIYEFLFTYDRHRRFS